MTGIPLFCRKSRAALAAADPGSRFVHWVFDKAHFLPFLAALLAADLAYLIGGDNLCRPRNAFFFRLFLSLGRRVVVHWVGSDVSLIPRPLPRFFRRRGLVHLCEAGWIQEELANAGLDAKIVPLLGIDTPEEIPAWPEKFSVLAYVPEGRGELYGLQKIVNLARSFPGMSFRIMGLKQAPDFPENLRAIGWTSSVPGEMRGCVCYLRLNSHDGLSVSVLEALASGRYVAYSMPLEGCYHADNDAELRGYLARLEASFNKGGLAPNEAGWRFVRQTYSRKKVCDGLLSEFGAAIRKAGSP